MNQAQMKLTIDPITGSNAPVNHDTPLTALNTFYAAFNNQDFELIQSNWLQNDEASMSNPLGGIKRGWNEIKEVYEKIFNGPAKVYVEFYDYSIHETESMFVAVGRERGTLTINDKTMELAIRTSRTYVKDNNTWKQIHHHGSMETPAMLQNYQSILLNK